MKNTKPILILLMGIFTLLFSTPVQGQFLKNLKKKATEAVEKKIDEIGQKKQPKITDQQKPTEPYAKKEVPKQENEIQSKKPTKEIVIDDSDILIYKSPSNAFNDIAIQKHKDLPRFGTCNFYKKTNSNSPIMTAEYQEKRKKFGYSYPGFLKLAKMHMMKEYFVFLDKTALTELTRDLVEEEVKSNLVQKMLLDFAFTMGTDTFKRNYFCSNPSTQTNCAYMNKWGGNRADDFTENEKYVDFITKYLDVITDWSSNFFKNENETFYLVSPTKFIGTYDFDKNGFWVPLPVRARQYGLDYSSTNDNYFFEYSPKAPYENTMFNKITEPEFYNGFVLIKVNPEKAEVLVNKKLRQMYFVSKVQVDFKEIDTTNINFNHPSYTYHYVNPIIELYEDEGLTQKIGEISLENLTHKEPN